VTSIAERDYFLKNKGALLSKRALFLGPGSEHRCDTTNMAEKMGQGSLHDQQTAQNRAIPPKSIQAVQLCVPIIHIHQFKGKSSDS